MRPVAILLSALSLVSSSHALCPHPGLFLPWGDLEKDDFAQAGANLAKSLDSVFSALRYGAAVKSTPGVNITGLTPDDPARKILVSIAVTSSKGVLWTYNFGKSAEAVTTDTVFRVASVSKVFTALEILAKGIGLGEPILKYVPALGDMDPSHKARWEEVTVGSLGSWMSGLGRDFAIGDLAYLAPVLTNFGFPPLPANATPSCGLPPSSTGKPCTWQEILRGIASRNPVYPSFTSPSYSNIAFSVLYQALKRVSGGKSYQDLISQDILKPLKMQNTTTRLPFSDASALSNWFKRGAIAVGSEGAYGLDFGAEFGDPFGGIYSTAHDLSLLLRDILKAYDFQSPTTSLPLKPHQIRAWLSPSSFGLNSPVSFGFPWEIIRHTYPGLRNGFPVTLYGKSGGLAGYSSRIDVLPEYGVGVVALMNTDIKTSGALGVMDTVLKAILPVAEAVGRRDAGSEFAGAYRDNATDSMVKIVVVPEKQGMSVEVLRVRGVDMIAALGNPAGIGGFLGLPAPLDVTLSPTGRGDEWRVTLDSPGSGQGDDGTFGGVCPGYTEADLYEYGGEPVDLLTFERDGKGAVKGLSLAGFRSQMVRV